MVKQTVHNLMEAKVLIKESYARGEEQMYDGTRWYTHQGAFICLSNTFLTEFTLHLDTKDSLTVEVL